MEARVKRASDSSAGAPANDPGEVLRILDANLNRLREALRVIEEYFRFVENSSSLSAQLKEMRQSVGLMERALGPERLLASRDAAGDPLADVHGEGERRRDHVADIARANLKRAEEASRVIEEYGKVSGCPGCSETAKELRFKLYTFEKSLMESASDAPREEEQ